MFKFKKSVAFLLTLVMIFGCMSCVWAASGVLPEPERPDEEIDIDGLSITTSGGFATTPVELTQDALEFSVTVPTSIPIHVDSDGHVTMPDNITIINNTVAPIEIKNIAINGANGWTKTTDTSGWQANDKKFVMTLDYSDDQVTNWTFAVAPRTTAITDSHIANVVFTVGWATGRTDHSGGVAM